MDRRDYECGEIIWADCRLDDQEIDPVLEIEIKLDEGLECMLTFESSKIPTILEMISKNKSVKSLEGERVKLMPHPRGGTWAPIAISKGLLNQWVYKRHSDTDRSEWGNDKHGYLLFGRAKKGNC